MDIRDDVLYVFTRQNEANTRICKLFKKYSFGNNEYKTIKLDSGDYINVIDNGIPFNFEWYNDRIVSSDDITHKFKFLSSIGTPFSDSDKCAYYRPDFTKIKYVAVIYTDFTDDEIVAYRTCSTYKEVEIRHMNYTLFPILEVNETLPHDGTADIEYNIIVKSKHKQIIPIYKLVRNIPPLQEYNIDNFIEKLNTAISRVNQEIIYKNLSESAKIIKKSVAHDAFLSNSVNILWHALMLTLFFMIPIACVLGFILLDSETISRLTANIFTSISSMVYFMYFYISSILIVTTVKY